jgi:hypothetical protein
MAMDVNEFLVTITPEQRKWVIERVRLTTDKAAAEAVGVSAVTVCRWKNKKQLDWAVQELLKDPQRQALEILTQAAVDAARAKAESIYYTDAEGNRKVRQGVASEILDRVLGQALERREHTGRDGGPIEIIEDARIRLLAAVEREVGPPDSGAEDQGDTRALTAGV